MTQWLKQSTAVTIQFGPFVDAGDGVALETGLATAMDNATTGIRVSKNGAVLVDRNSVTAPAYDAMGLYRVELDATDTNTLGTLKIIFEEAATCLPVWQDFMVVPANVWDSMFGADALQVDTIQVSGTTQTANDIGADANTLVTRVPNTLNTTASGNIGIDWANIENPTTAQNLSATNIDVDQIVASVSGNVDGSVSGTVTLTAASIDSIWDEALTGATHNVADSAARRLRDLQEFGVYEGGAIWIDTVNGTAGTTNYESGTAFNPVDTIADANTLAASLGISRFQVAPGSTITLAASQLNQVFLGEDWTLALGGQNVDGSIFHGANVSGVATNTAGAQYFIDCDMGACTLPGDTHLGGCAISGTQTIGETGDYFADGCHSAVAGGGSPTLDIASTANVNVNWRHYSGGLAIANGVATTTMSYESDGQVTVNATCTSLDLTVRGNCTITDNGTTTVLTQDAAVNRTNINAEADTALTDYDAVVPADLPTNFAAMNITASGNMGVDWANVENQATAVDLSATDIQLADTVTTLTGHTVQTGDSYAVLAGAHAEPTGVPAANETVADKIGYLFMALRNRLDVSATKKTFYDDSGAAEWEKDLSDNGTTYSETEGNAI